MLLSVGDLTRVPVGTHARRVEGDEMTTVAPAPYYDPYDFEIDADPYPVWKRLRDEAPQSAWQHLSMGMTGDYRIAIEEGATIVRVGRAIFGERTHV